MPERDDIRMKKSIFLERSRWRFQLELTFAWMVCVHWACVMFSKIESFTHQFVEGNGKK